LVKIMNNFENKLNQKTNKSKISIEMLI